MNKLHTILAGSALAMFTQFAAAQTTGSTMPSATPIDTSGAAYTDQSRANQSSDPYVKKRVATKEARDEYKADKKAAKSEYKDEKKAAKSDYKAARKDATATRKSELADPSSTMQQSEPVVPNTGK